jgi:hypothetical protein
MSKHGNAMTGSEVNWFFNVENVTIASFGSSPSLSRILSCELEQWCHDDGKIFYGCLGKIAQAYK